MNGVFVVPTGIGAEIGGHAGDATPAAKLVASVCDKLIVHPNVVNASDINEMTANMLYVEGSFLNRFLEGEIGLKEVWSNKILLVHNQPQNPSVINAASSARVTIGAKVNILELRTPLLLKAEIVDGVAKGSIEGMEAALKQIKHYPFDVLVVNTPISVDKQSMREYMAVDGGVNLWGGVEAMLSKQMSTALAKPVIHAPVPDEETNEVWKEVSHNVVDPRKAPETASECCVHCCLKGGHKAPKISRDSFVGMWVRDIDFLITPLNVWGPPHKACHAQGIPVIAVAENKTVLSDPMPEDTIIATDYLQAVGMIVAMTEGISPETVRRPLEPTRLL